jgi:hypothetical protein
VNDRSRSDGLATGAVVTLTSVTPGTTNAWALLWVPDADVAAEASITPSGVTSTFTPTVGARGTYRIRLTVDAGLPTESISIRTFSVRTASAALRIPALNERADPAASLINDGAVYIAASESNENGTGPFSTGNYGGYYTAMKELFDRVELIVTTGVATHAATHLPGGADALTTAAPSIGIGAANSAGTAASFARSDHSHALRTTTGPTDLAVGAIADGEFLKRVGATIVSAALVAGGNFVARRTVTGPTTVTVLATDHLIMVDTTAGAVTLTLPDPATTDRIYEIKDIAGTFGTNACTLARFAGGDQIEGLAANYLLEANWQIQRIGSNGVTKWWLF